MKRRLKRNLRVACACLACLAAVALVASGFLRPHAPPAAPGAAGGDAGAEAALDRVLPEVDWESVPFDEGVARVGRLTGVPVVVERDALSAAGFDPKARLTFRARNATAAWVLAEVCRAASTPQCTVGFGVAGGRILVSGGDALATKTVSVRLYDVRDLLARAADDPWWEWPQPIVEYAYVPPLPPAGAAPRPAEELMKAVEDFVASDSWRDSGGVLGSLYVFAGRLVVTQTWQNHRAVADLLAQLRAPGPGIGPGGPYPGPTPNPAVQVWDDRVNRFVPAHSDAGESALRRRQAEVRLDAMHLDEAVSALAEKWQTHLVADWSALASAGINRRVRVSLHLRHVTLADALRALSAAAARLSSPTSGNGEIVFTPDGDSITLTSRRELMHSVFIRAYDIRDWITAVVGPPPLRGAAGRAAWEAARDAAVGSMTRTIEGTIDPDSWTGGGGASGTIREVGGRLWVEQTWENQQAVADAIAALRGGPARATSPADSPAGGGQNPRD